jgi:hypothetical protein
MVITNYLDYVILFIGSNIIYFSFLIKLKLNLNSNLFINEFTENNNKVVGNSNLNLSTSSHSSKLIDPNLVRLVTKLSYNANKISIVVDKTLLEFNNNTNLSSLLDFKYKIYFNSLKTLNYSQNKVSQLGSLSSLNKNLAYIDNDKKYIFFNLNLKNLNDFHISKFSNFNIYNFLNIAKQER